MDRAQQAHGPRASDDRAGEGLSSHRVTVGPLPPWLDRARLLGPGEWSGDAIAVAHLERDAACDLAARLRGLGLDGRPVEVDISPAPKRRHLRAARTVDAGRRRDTTPGFSRRGARTDEQGRVSLTPEALALDLGERHAGRRVVDASCGVGGNSIGFARAGCTVTAIDLDRRRLALAAHNAEVYRVRDRITFVHGDARALVPDLAHDVLFVDPPWGIDWDRIRTTVDDLPLLAGLLDQAPLIAKVPPSFDTATVPGARATAVFGQATGDYRRIKFVLLDV